MMPSWCPTTVPRRRRKRKTTQAAKHFLHQLWKRFTSARSAVSLPHQVPRLPPHVFRSFSYVRPSCCALESCLRHNCSPIALSCFQVIQLYETFMVRFGVMLVGPAGGGKTRCYQTLKSAMTQLRKDGNPDTNYQVTRQGKGRHTRIKNVGLARTIYTHRI